MTKFSEKKRIHLVISTLVLVFGWVLAWVLPGVFVKAASQTASPERNFKPSVALVDREKIFAKSLTLEEGLAGLEAKYEPIFEEFSREKAKLQALNDSLKALAPDSEAFRDAVEELLLRSAALETREILVTKHKTEEKVRLYQKVEADFQFQLRRCAGHFGFCLILNDAHHSVLPESFLEGETLKIPTWQMVWFRASQVDLTRLILCEMEKHQPGSVRTEDEWSITCIYFGAPTSTLAPAR